MCNSCDWKEALADIEESLPRLEKLPEAAEDFACSVQEKLESMATWIEENEHVTEAQSTAIQNMINGIEKWENNGR